MSCAVMPHVVLSNPFYETRETVFMESSNLFQPHDTQSVAGMKHAVSKKCAGGSNYSSAKEWPAQNALSKKEAGS